MSTDADVPGADPSAEGAGPAVPGALLSRLRPSFATLVKYGVPQNAAFEAKLDANESPYTLSPELREGLARRLADLSLHRYPDAAATQLRQRLAASLAASPEELVLGTGSDEVIAMLINAFAGPERAVLFPGPSFVMYAITARSHGVRPVEVPLAADFRLDEEALRRALEAEAPAVAFYASPNNPTGNVFDEAVLGRLARAFPATLHVVDEAYGPFRRAAGGDAPASHVGLLRTHGNVALLGTLSKIGLAGLRVGWLRARPALAAEIEKSRQPFNLNAPAQAAATYVLEAGEEELAARIGAIVEARGALLRGLEALPGVTPFPTEANFVLFRLAEGTDASRFKASLAERGVAVRVFTRHPRLAGHVRVTVGTPEENALFLLALAELLA
ncbi:MAG: histidinol-phosphate transaminase [Myxococcota bacterium]